VELGHSTLVKFLSEKELRMNHSMISQGEKIGEKKAFVMPKLSKYTVPALYIVAIILIGISTVFPYWGLTLEAPQYPDGLSMRVFVNYITGDEDPTLDEVREIDGLNHYIGMKSLFEAAKFERLIAVPAIILMLALLLIAAFWNKRFSWLLTLPAIAFPFIYLADLWFWMAYYGNNLDPYAPLSSAIHPFTPPILGEGVIGQFKTVASVQTGWFIAVFAVLLIITGLVIRYQEYRRQRAS
jgi:copper chaperone NosL